MRLTRLFVASVMMLALAPGVSAVDWDAPIIELSDGWASVMVAHETEPSGPPGEAADLDGPLPDKVDHWYSVAVPGDLEGPRALVFSCYRARVEVWVDSTIVYRSEDLDTEGRLAIHLVQLESPGGRLLSIRLPLDVGGTSIQGEPLLTMPDIAPTALARVSSEPVREDFPKIMAACALLVVALVSIIVSLVRWKLNERALLFFGLFTLVYGVRLLLGSSISLMAGVPQMVGWRLESALTYLINVPATLFALAVFGRGWKSSILWMARAAVVFVFVGLLSDIVTGVPFSAHRLNNVLVIANGIVLIVTMAQWEARKSKDGIVLTVGIVFFGILALFENLRGLFEVFEWSEGTEWVGFVVLIAVLGWVALRRFLAGEAELIEIGKELEMARSIQRAILPGTAPTSDRLEVRSRYIPMTSVAGDFYDYYEMPDGRIGVLVADVSGHGVPAAMVASMVKVAASTHAEESSDPAELMAALNRTLCHHLGREFVTVTWMVFDPAAMTVRVCNAGHPPPLRLTNGSIRPLGGFGILVGKFRNARYKAATIELEEGDRILCFTDGITEATNASEEEYGYARLEANLASSRRFDLDGMLDSLIGDVGRWSGKAQQGDDLTLVGIDVRGAR